MDGGLASITVRGIGYTEGNEPTHLLKLLSRQMKPLSYNLGDRGPKTFT